LLWGGFLEGEEGWGRISQEVTVIRAHEMDKVWIVGYDQFFFVYTVATFRLPYVSDLGPRDCAHRIDVRKIPDTHKKGRNWTPTELYIVILIGLLPYKPTRILSPGLYKEGRNT